MIGKAPSKCCMNYERPVYAGPKHRYLHRLTVQGAGEPASSEALEKDRDIEMCGSV